MTDTETTRLPVAHEVVIGFHDRDLEPDAERTVYVRLLSGSGSLGLRLRHDQPVKLLLDLFEEGCEFDLELSPGEPVRMIAQPRGGCGFGISGVSIHGAVPADRRLAAAADRARS